MWKHKGEKGHAIFNTRDMKDLRKVLNLIIINANDHIKSAGTNISEKNTLKDLIIFHVQNRYQ